MLHLAPFTTDPVPAVFSQVRKKKEGDEKWSDTVLFKGIIDGFAGGLNVLLEKRIQDDFIF